MPGVLLRYAVEGIASSLRRLAPRNDNHKCRRKTGKACLGRTTKDGDIRRNALRPILSPAVVPMIPEEIAASYLAAVLGMTGSKGMASYNSLTHCHRASILKGGLPWTCVNQFRATRDRLGG